MEDQLTALDATFLELEEADQSAHMHIGGVMLLEPQPGGGAPPIDLIRRDVIDRLPDLPRYTQRLSTPHTADCTGRAGRRTGASAWSGTSGSRASPHPAESTSSSNGPASTTRSASTGPSRSGRWWSWSSPTVAGRSSPRPTTA